MEIKINEVDILKLRLKEGETLVVKCTGPEFDDPNVLQSFQNTMKQLVPNNKVLVMNLPEKHSMKFEIIEPLEKKSNQLDDEDISVFTDKVVGTCIMVEEINLAKRSDPLFKIKVQDSMERMPEITVSGSGEVLMDDLGFTTKGLELFNEIVKKYIKGEI